MMPDEPALITVGMPVYNGADTVERAIRSLLEQSQSDFELHIADDGSTDDTPAICRRLAREDDRITFEVHPQNIGMTANFNYLMHAARSPYFMWAAQDDRWDANLLREGLRFLTRHPDTSGYAAGIQFEDETGTPLTTTLPPAGLADENPVVRAQAVAHGGFHAIYALFRHDLLLAGPTLEDVAGTDIAFMFGKALQGPFCLEATIRSYRLVHGYRLVLDADGRPVNQKALGPSGQLYSRNPDKMCLLMARYVRASGLSSIEMARLFWHIGLRWWLGRWRWVIVSNTTFRIKGLLKRSARVDAAARSARDGIRRLPRSKGRA